jgi:hypothetical protein
MLVIIDPTTVYTHVVSGHRDQHTAIQLWPKADKSADSILNCASSFNIVNATMAHAPKRIPKAVIFHPQAKGRVGQ